MKFFSDLFNLVFPQICLSCHSRLQPEEIYLCRECEKSLEYLEGEICPKCGEPLSDESSHRCDFSFDAARSVFKFNPILKNLIHHFKYNEMTKVGKLLGNFAAEFLRKENFTEAEIVTPVPLHTVKKRIRGYNQSEFLTRQIAENMKWQHLPHLIQRKRFTETQTKLSRHQRKKNVAGAFVVNPKFEVKNRLILLVDDVFTTGSTVDSISKVLKEAGAKKIFVLTIARA